MAALVIMTPTVFFAIQRLFDWGDKLYAWILNKGWRGWGRRKLLSAAEEEFEIIETEE